MRPFDDLRCFDEQQTSKSYFVQCITEYLKKQYHCCLFKEFYSGLVSKQRARPCVNVALRLIVWKHYPMWRFLCNSDMQRRCIRYITLFVLVIIKLLAWFVFKNYYVLLKVEEHHDSILQYISTIGCAVSLFFILLTFTVMAVYWRRLKSPRVTLLLHLCTAIAASCILIIITGYVQWDEVTKTTFSLIFCVR